MANEVIVDDDGSVIVNDVAVTEIITEVNETTVVIAPDEVEVIAVEQSTTVIEAEDGTVVVQDVGVQGPEGPPAEEDVPFATRVDFIGDDLIYKAQATPGTLDAGSVWRIQEITFVGPEEDVEIRWADGVADFTKVWDDRLGYTYT